MDVGAHDAAASVLPLRRCLPSCLAMFVAAATAAAAPIATLTRCCTNALNAGDHRHCQPLQPGEAAHQGGQRHHEPQQQGHRAQGVGAGCGG